MSGDPEQEYFADGVVEDIITALSHLPRLFVIARNSSFTYKGQARDVRKVSRELGVHHPRQPFGFRQPLHLRRVPRTDLERASSLRVRVDHVFPDGSAVAWREWSAWRAGRIHLDGRRS